jgi:hypothetical protein
MILSGLKTTDHFSVTLATLQSLVIKGIAGATGNLFEAQDSNGGLLFAIGADGSINFGVDVNLYRASAGVLKTDSALIVARDITIEGNGIVKGAFSVAGAFAADSVETQRLLSSGKMTIKSGNNADVVISPDGTGRVRVGSGQNAFSIDANGVVTKSGLAVSNRGMETFNNLKAASPSSIRSNIFCTGTTYEETHFASQPDVPRIISVTAGPRASGSVTVWGTLADGTPNQSEVIKLTSNGLTKGTKAFSRIDKVILPATCPASETLDLGITDILGLSNLLHGQNGVYKVQKNGSDIAIPDVDTNNSTIDLTPLASGDNVTVWYKY